VHAVALTEPHLMLDAEARSRVGTMGMKH
jgi:hypothetical protein